MAKKESSVILTNKEDKLRMIGKVKVYAKSSQAKIHFPYSIAKKWKDKAVLITLEEVKSVNKEDIDGK